MIKFSLKSEGKTECLINFKHVVVGLTDQNGWKILPKREGWPMSELIRSVGCN